MDPQLYGQIIFDNAGKSMQWKKVSSINGAGKWDNHMQKNEIRPFSNPIHKDKLEMDSFIFLKILFSYLTERDTTREGTQAGGVGEEAGSLLSREPAAGLHPRTLGS